MIMGAAQSLRGTRLVLLLTTLLYNGVDLIWGHLDCEVVQSPYEGHAKLSLLPAFTVY